MNAAVRATNERKPGVKEQIVDMAFNGAGVRDTARTYDTNAILQHLKSLGIQAVIPSKENCLEQRTLDKHLYASRNLIERFFCRIKQFRHVATRYEKLSERFASFIALTAAFIWLC
ncbi:IS5/IS1182 family transposase [Sodalis-like symbiont of Philaenus spumarius]|nr:IS5/IS1182 family transposase [Sodalis-like symbiont of Philaenus spumarius]